MLSEQHVSGRRAEAASEHLSCCHGCLSSARQAIALTPSEHLRCCPGCLSSARQAIVLRPSPSIRDAARAV
ncbi:hypothetical protein OAO87_03145 [bacterium]|nr:hypothetical protein [bacterium]